MRALVRPLVSVAMALALLAPAAARAQQAPRPTPHQAIEHALRPVTDALEALHATEAERRDVADVLARAEELAVAHVELAHRGMSERAQSLARRLETLGRLARGRIEASRLEAEAGQREQAALAAEDRRVQARAALERVVERRIELEREPAPEPGSSRPPAVTSPPPTPAPTTTARPPRTVHGSSAAPGGAAHANH